MKNPLFLFLLCGLLSQCACKKSLLHTDDDDTPIPMTELEKLPPITSEGANSFGCLVNGEAWTPKGYIFPESNFDVYYDEVYFHGLFIDMFRRENNQDTNTERVIISLRTVENTTVIDTSQHLNISLLRFLPCIELEKVLSDNFTITKLDTINKIVAGTFEFAITIDEEGDSCQDTLYVTDGRFDAVYRY